VKIQGKKKKRLTIQTTPKDPLKVLIGSITRSRTKKAQTCIQWVNLEYLGQCRFQGGYNFNK
jgi:hypothetical protein